MSDDILGLEDVLEEAFAGRLAGLRVALPGRIESYDASSRRAVVQILVEDGDIAETGERITTRVPPISDVPVMRVGSGIERFRFPVRSGDGCLLVFASNSIAAWKSSGDVVDPADDRHHHEADAIAITGLFASGTDTPGTLIEIDDSDTLNLGVSPAPFEALLGTPYRAAEDTMLTSLGALAAALAVYAAAIKVIADPTNAATPPLLTAITAFTVALTTFQAGAAGYLSQKVKLI